MGQQNNSGRNASLDQNKQRAAGRQNTNSPEREAIRDPEFDKGKTSGAFGKDGEANRPSSGGMGSGGGGGGADPRARDADVAGQHQENPQAFLMPMTGMLRHGKEF